MEKWRFSAAQHRIWVVDKGGGSYVRIQARLRTLDGFSGRKATGEPDVEIK
jgi:hypothetical protein